MYAFTIDVPAPMPVYTAVHRAILQATGGPAAGMLMHIGRATDSGFQVIEVWTSREAYDEFAQTTVAPILAGLGEGPSVPLEPVPFALGGVILAGDPVTV